jgi:hypothetical protein
MLASGYNFFAVAFIKEIVSNCDCSENLPSPLFAKEGNVYLPLAKGG